MQAASVETIVVLLRANESNIEQRAVFQKYMRFVNTASLKFIEVSA